MPSPTGRSLVFSIATCRLRSAAGTGYSTGHDIFPAMTVFPVIWLPSRLQHTLEATSSALLRPQGGRLVDFTRPVGEAALVAPDSISWRIFKNPVALCIGGIAAVILELAEPAVRTGVWEHSAFRQDPLGRMRRTGLAAMITVYGARSVAEPMIAGVVRMHRRVRGETPSGAAYRANDADLLTWVQATASFGFGQAYSHYVAALGLRDFDVLHREGLPASQLYGAIDAPASLADLHSLFESMRGRLEPSQIVFDFLEIMSSTPNFPQPLRWMQRMLVRAAVELIPVWIRKRLELDATYGLRTGERLVVRAAGALADRIVLADSPPSLACRRLALPKTYLYR
jgi:uncharacterized protein (DUF2236 family)